MTSKLRSASGASTAREPDAEGRPAQTVAVMTDLQAQIDELWDRRDELTGDADARESVHEAIDSARPGEARVAELGGDDDVVVHEWLKQAILLLFRAVRRWRRSSSARSSTPTRSR